MYFVLDFTKDLSFAHSNAHLRVPEAELRDADAATQASRSECGASCRALRRCARRHSTHARSECAVSGLGHTDN